MKNNHYRIAIKDTGWGIPKKAQKKLGQQFFRVKQADKPAQPGYGLGLSSVMLMAKEMGGSLTFQSEEVSVQHFSLTYQPKTHNTIWKINRK